MRSSPGAALCILAVVASGEASAEAALVFELDNDKFSGTDRHYTNGVRLFGVWEPPGPEESPLVGALDTLPFLPEGGRRRVALGIGQSIFTPEDLDRADLIRRDRPYAGWLYAALSYLRETDAVASKWQLALGLVGPQAFAEEAQDSWHRIINVSKARGWDNQLKNEPALHLTYDRTWKALAWSDPGLFGIEADLSPNAGFALGNVMVYGAAGATVRFGVNYDRTVEVAQRRPGLPGTESSRAPDRSKEARPIAAYVFAGVEGRAVARNIFLDGNTFRDSHSVDRNLFVADLSAGISLKLYFLQLTYAQVLRSSEFDGQSGFDRFGSIGVTLNF